MDESKKKPLAKGGAFIIQANIALATGKARKLAGKIQNAFTASFDGNFALNDHRGIITLAARHNLIVESFPR